MDAGRPTRPSAAIKGAVVGFAAVLPVIVLVFLSFGDAPSRAGLTGAIVAFGSAAGAWLGRVAGRLARRRLLGLFLRGLGAYGLGLLAYTEVTILRASSAPVSFVPRMMLGLLIAAVTAPVAIPPLLVGLWFLERWTRRRAT